MSSRNIKYREDWGVHRYIVDGEDVDRIRSVKINGQKHDVVGRRESTPVSDMGHDYVAYSTRYFVKADVSGVEVLVALEEFIKGGATVEIRK